VIRVGRRICGRKERRDVLGFRAFIKLMLRSPSKYKALFCLHAFCRKGER